MDSIVLASSECDPSSEIICAPTTITELFEFRTPLFEILGFPVTKTVVLIFLAALLGVLFLWLGLRKRSVVPGKGQLITETVVGFVRNDIAVGIIGPEGVRYFPYLLALFVFILIGNAFEVIPGISFPITSRVALPLFLALLTWVIFIAAGLKRQGWGYLKGIVWPASVPIALRWFVGIIEFVSTIFLRPLTLAIRLFANLVAGHLMLTLLLVSGWIFMSNIGNIGPKALIGLAWFVIGLGIYLFEVVVILLQAYIFTLLSAVYIQTSLYPEH